MVYTPQDVMDSYSHVNTNVVAHTVSLLRDILMKAENNEYFEEILELDEIRKRLNELERKVVNKSVSLLRERK